VNLAYETGFDHGRRKGLEVGRGHPNEDLAQAAQDTVGAGWDGEGEVR
jgi:hypothetical protein